MADRRPVSATASNLEDLLWWILPVGREEVSQLFVT